MKKLWWPQLSEFKTAPGFPAPKKSNKPPFQISSATGLKKEQIQKCRFITGSSRKITKGNKRLPSLPLLHFFTCA